MTTDSTRPRRSRLSWLWRVVSIALVIAGVAWVLHAINPSDVAHMLKAADLRLVVLAALLNLVAIGLQATRWNLLLAPLGKVRLADSLAALVCGFAVSSVVPARAGEIARIRLQSRRSELSASSVGGTVVLDHIINAVALVPLVAVLPFGTDAPGWARTAVIVLIALATAASISVWLLAPGPDATARVDEPDSWTDRLRVGFAAVRSPSHALAALGIGVCAWVAEAAVVGTALRAFDISMPWAQAGLVLVVLNAALALPAPPGNIGTLEVGAVIAATTLGASQDAAFAFALAYHALHLGSVWIVTPPMWLYARRDLKPA